MSFTIGDKVTGKKNSRWNSPAHKGIIVSMGFENGMSGSIFYTVRGSNNYNYNYSENDLTITKVQKLYAYLDPTEEVHWATKNYTTAELKSFGLSRADKFDKTIELE